MNSFGKFYTLLEALDPAFIAAMKASQDKYGKKPASPAATKPTSDQKPPAASQPVATPTNPQAAAPENDDFSLTLGNPEHDKFHNGLEDHVADVMKYIDNQYYTSRSNLEALESALDQFAQLANTKDPYTQKVVGWANDAKQSLSSFMDSFKKMHWKLQQGE